jgi:hypothetical protein
MPLAGFLSSLTKGEVGVRCVGVSQANVEFEVGLKFGVA